MNTAPFIDFEQLFRYVIDSLTGISFSNIPAFFASGYVVLKVIGIFISLIFLMLIVYVEGQMHKLHELEHADDHEIEHKAHALLHGDSHGHGSHGTHGGHGGHGKDEPVVNHRWEKIVRHMTSKNPTDWRLAILEADIVLEEMLEKMGYNGDTLSDKLKSVEKSDFTTIENAWEAHKIRNAIAHEGSDFLLSEREAKRIIGLYESVFREFHFI